jgi:hypothetical protein
MKKSRIFDRRSGYLVAALAVLFGVTAPAVLSSTASADLLVGRKIEMSSSKSGETGVKYKLTLATVPTAASTLVLAFCSNSPIIGDSCTAPTGFDATGVTVTEGGTATLEASTTNVIKYTPGTSISSGATNVSYEFNGIKNPTTSVSGANGTFYARVMTYGASFSGYTNISTPGTPLDSGGFALAVVNPLKVTATIRETLQFCVNKLTITASCANATTAPTLALGHGSPAALDFATTDTDSAYAQISTNASSGAVVSMKIDNSCGGLTRNSGTSCDIAAQGTSPANAAALLGTGKLGLNVGAGSGVSPTSGSITSLAPYSTASSYGLNYVSGNATGVGSTYGDPIFNTGGNPIANYNVPLTFAASASTSTPAGNYSANFFLTAAGTF